MSAVFKTARAVENYYYQSQKNKDSKKTLKFEQKCLKNDNNSDRSQR